MGSIQLKPSGGFNHYLVASQLTSHLELGKVDEETLKRFEDLFNQINPLFLRAEAS